MLNWENCKKKTTSYILIKVNRKENIKNIKNYHVVSIGIFRGYLLFPFLIVDHVFHYYKEKYN